MGSVAQTAPVPEFTWREAAAASGATIKGRADRKGTPVLSARGLRKPAGLHSLTDARAYGAEPYSRVRSSVTPRMLVGSDLTCSTKPLIKLSPSSPEAGDVQLTDLLVLHVT